jgi:hypothetical protein
VSAGARRWPLAALIALASALAGCSDGDGDDGARDADAPMPRAGSSAAGGGTAARSGAGGTSGAAGSGNAGRPSDAGASDARAGGAGGAPGDAGAAGSGDAAQPSMCVPPAAFDGGISWQQTFHVAMNGNDGSGDGSEARPFATIEHALQSLAPGMRVLVHAGTYGPFSAEGLAGEPGRPIGIIADGAVVLEARGASAVIAMSDPEYVVIQGFTLQGATVHGMNIDDGGSYDSPAHHVVLRDLTIPSAGSGDNNDCIKLSGVDDFWVLDSDVAGCDRGEIIDMVGCHRGVIAGNHFHDTIQNGVQTKGGSADTLIHGNRFENIPARAVNAGGSTGLEFFRPLDAAHEAARIAIIANVFVRNGQESGAAVAYVGCDGCVAAHNTVIEPRTWIARILQESNDARFVPSRNGRFMNNIIVLDPGDLRAELVNVGADTAPETFAFSNNLWFAPGQPASWRPNLGGGVPDESDPLVQMDPRMLDRAGGDYHLQPDSPARGAARTIDTPVPGDFDGRCYATPPTLGAFEIAQ